MAKLDTAFMKRATRITSFNLSASDFQTTTYKREIQELYRSHMFGSFDPDDSLKRMDRNKFNSLVSDLKKDDRDQFYNLHYLQLKGVGPGEATLYLLTQDGHLGGGSSAGVDLVMGGEKYEVKAVKWKDSRRQNAVSDFKLGGNIPGMTHLESEIQRIMYEKRITQSPGAPEISGSKFQQLKDEEPAVYANLEAQYQKLAMKYFSAHKVVFIQNAPTRPDFGEIISVKRVRQQDIMMERYTSRTLKPIVRI